MSALEKPEKRPMDGQYSNGPMFKGDRDRHMTKNSGNSIQNTPRSIDGVSLEMLIFNEKPCLNIAVNDFLNITPAKNIIKR